MGYFQVRYDSRVINYDCRGFIRLATGREIEESKRTEIEKGMTSLLPVAAVTLYDGDLGPIP